jgi:hypothetical protein
MGACGTTEVMPFFTGAKKYRAVPPPVILGTFNPLFDSESAFVLGVKRTEMSCLVFAS